MNDNFLIIVGAMKCGTSSLFHYLAQHPELATVTSKKKELHFFSDRDNFARGYDYYRSLWDWDKNTHKYALESTPAYTRSTHPQKMNAAKNIAKMQAETGARFKFIYIMRNPIDRIESQYNHALAWEKEIMKDFSAIEIDQEALDTSKYAMQINEYYKRFDASDILLLNFNDLQNEPQKLLRRICQFLDIDPNYNFQSLSQVYNQRGSKKIVKIPGWSNLKKSQIFVIISRNIPLSLKEVFRHFFKKPKTKADFKLSDKQRQFAQQNLISDLIELKNLQQINIDSWGIKL